MPRALSQDAPLYEALLPHVDDKDRHALLEEALALLGWRWRFWPSLAPAWLRRFSMALAPLRLVIISSHLEPLLLSEQLPALIHEITHARRAEDYGRFSWALAYLFSPSFRRAEEIEADAWGLAMMTALVGGCATDPSRSTRLVKHARDSAAQWSEWAAPYFCGGDVDDGADALLERAWGILARAVAG